MSLASIFDRRVRGFRVVELVCLCILLVLVLGVYMAKTFAGRERAQIASVEQQIDDEKVRVRLLKAEVAYLEQPRRIQMMAQQLGLAPISPERETTEDALIDVARHAPVPHAPASPTAAVNDGTAAAEAPESSPDDYPAPEEASGQASGQTSGEAPR
jgi:cell division protein FtsL